MKPHRRKRWPWLLLALLAALVLLAPGLLGALVHQRTDAMLAESWPEATVRWQRGWLTSRVEAADGQAHLVLELAHPPLDGSGPLAADGRLTLAAPEARIALDAALGWALHLDIDARAPALRSDTAVSLTAERPRLSLWRSREGALDLRLEATALDLAGPPDARLATRELVLRVAADGNDPGRLELDLSATRPGRPASRLHVEAERIDGERTGALTEALGAALQARPGSATASIAWLGVAGAWEQLAQAGLVVEISPLSINGDARIDGRWMPAEGPLKWSGRGELEALEDWLVPILGLVRAEPSARLRDELRLQFERAAQTGSLTIDNDRFELPAPPPND